MQGRVFHASRLQRGAQTRATGGPGVPPGHFKRSGNVHILACAVCASREELVRAFRPDHRFLSVRAGRPHSRPLGNYDPAMAEAKSKASTIETVEPIGKRVLIRKDEDKKQTKSGIHLPDKIEIPTLTGRVVAISAMVEHDKDYPIKQYDRVLFAPKQAIPVDFEGDNRLFVIPVEDVVAVFRREE